MKLLVVKANPKPEQASVTQLALKKFLSTFQQTHPEAEITTRDVTNYPHLSAELLRDYRNPNGEVAQIAKEFGQYDRYIFVSPMWNLTIPSGLKAYIDHLIIPDVTFTYEQGNPKPVGLLKDKKALFITASGGHFGVPPMIEWDHNVTYMKHILAHIGIEEYTPLYTPIAHRGGISPQERINQEVGIISKCAVSW